MEKLAELLWKFLPEVIAEGDNLSSTNPKRILVRFLLDNGFVTPEQLKRVHAE